MEVLVNSRIQRLLADEPVAHVAVLAEGRPYVTPISFVWLDGALWFRTMPGRRLSALLENPWASAEVSRFDVQTGEWESVILSGSVGHADGAKDETRVMHAIREKYRRISRSAIEMPPDVVPTIGSVMVLMPEEISGRGSGRGINGPDRPGLL